MYIFRHTDSKKKDKKEIRRNVSDIINNIFAIMGVGHEEGMFLGDFLYTIFTKCSTVNT